MGREPRENTDRIAYAPSYARSKRSSAGSRFILALEYSIYFKVILSNGQVTMMPQSVHDWSIYSNSLVAVSTKPVSTRRLLSLDLRQRSTQSKSNRQQSLVSTTAVASAYLRPDHFPSLVRVLKDNYHLDNCESNYLTLVNDNHHWMQVRLQTSKLRNGGDLHSCSAFYESNSNDQWTEAYFNGNFARKMSGSGITIMTISIRMLVCSHE